MSAVEFPSTERMNLVGSLSRAEVAGVAAMVIGAAAGLLGDALIPGLVFSGLAGMWTFLPTRRTPLRVIVPRELAWLAKRKRRWSANVTGNQRGPAFLGVEVCLYADKNNDPVGVVKNRDRYVAMWLTTRPSLAFASEDEVGQAMSSWGDVVAGLCVERNSELVPQRIGWVDLHHAADPLRLERQHQEHGKPGPATADYERHVARFDQAAASHDVVVFVEMSSRTALRLAKKAGYSGPREEVMLAVTCDVATGVRDDMSTRGFQCGALMTPEQVGRFLADAVDPFAPRRERTQRERFDLADRVEPESTVMVERRRIVVDRSIHRCYRLEWPTIAQPLNWSWKMIGEVPGPKMVTAVFEGVPPSRADREMSSRLSIGINNNKTASRVSVKNMRKVEAVRKAEQRVADGFVEAEGYVLVVLSGMTEDEVADKARKLQAVLRHSGHASVRELHGLHDDALRAALPIGHRVLSDQS